MARTCPFCGRGDLGRHCDSTTCPWSYCKPCRIRFNHRTHTATDTNSRPVTWPKTEPT